MNLRKAREEEINMRRRAGLVVFRTMKGLFSKGFQPAWKMLVILTAFIEAVEGQIVSYVTMIFKQVSQHEDLVDDECYKGHQPIYHAYKKINRF